MPISDWSKWYITQTDLSKTKSHMQLIKANMNLRKIDEVNKSKKLDKLTMNDTSKLAKRYIGIL